jgi:hypothetical protein
VNPTTCVATHVAAFSGAATTYNGLTFTLGGDLIAVDRSGNASKIDLTSGAATVVGNYGGNLGSSGDLVALQNGTLYATAYDSSGVITDDILVKLDATTYAATVVGTLTGYRHIYGLGFWGGRLSGFDDQGEILQIDPASAQVTVIGAATGTPWFGAGSTPLAPLR